MTVARLAANGLTAQNVLKNTSLPIICKVLLPTLFLGSTLLSGPKHSNSIPSIIELAVRLSVDENEVVVVPNPLTGLALKSLSGPQTEEEEVDLCDRGHLLLPPSLQMVIPFTTPTTVHVKEKVSPGHVG